MTDRDKLKREFLKRKTLEYRKLMVEAEQGNNDDKKEQYRQIILERLEWLRKEKRNLTNGTT